MEGLSLSIATTSSTSGHACGFRLTAPSFSNFRNHRTNISLLPRKPRNKLLVFAASGNESELRKWVNMELEWGNLIGEDPELTLAKIVGRKSYPGLTDLELQELYEKEGKAAFPELDKLPFDLSESRKKPSVKRKTGNSEKNEVSSNVSEINGLKLVRPPVPKKGFEYEVNYKPRVIKKRIQPVVKTVEKSPISGPSLTLRKPSNFFDGNSETDKSLELSEEWDSSMELAERQRKDRLIDSLLARKPNPYISETGEEPKSLQSDPSITLRKPTKFYENNIGADKSLELNEELDSLLEMSERQSKERLIDSKLVRKPEPYILENREEASQEAQAVVKNDIEKNNSISLLQKPEIVNLDLNDDEKLDNSVKAIPRNKSIQSETLVDVSLLQKPEIVNLDLNDDEKLDNSVKAIPRNKSIQSETLVDVSLLQKPEIVNLDLNDDEKLDNSVKAIPRNKSIQSETLVNVSLLQKPEIVNLDLNTEIKQEDSGGQRESNSGILMEMENARNTNLDQSLESMDYSASLQKPKRLDHSAKQKLTKSGDGRIVVNPESSSNTFEHENFSAQPPIKEHENRDWERAEELIKVGGREEVELISASTAGFAVLFGSLIGVLPHRNVGTRWRYLTFESWLRKKGLDPSNYKQNLGIGGKYEATNTKTSLDSIVNSKAPSEVEVGSETSPDMKRDDLLVIYNQEKVKYLSSLVGQKILVYVVFADRESRKLIFSSKQKEKEESIEKKKRLMAKLSIGDIVKCCITNIMDFGIFVEVEGVSALIHQSELSWDDTLDLSSHFKSGQVIDAKVTQLDFSSGRIYLSLKEITPDPLIETLESALIDSAFLKAVQPDTEWTEVDLLVKELMQYEGIQSVSKGQYFLSPGLTPTFLVYMTSTFEDQYKLLARSENKVQEVIVKTSLSREEMKNAILTCTNRVK